MFVCLFCFNSNLLFKCNRLQQARTDEIENRQNTETDDTKWCKHLVGNRENMRKSGQVALITEGTPGQVKRESRKDNRTDNRENRGETMTDDKPV